VALAPASPSSVPAGSASTPEGPKGKRSSMFKGLADSIYAGTKNPAPSVKRVEHLASADCQDVVASKAVVFPAIKSSSEKAAAFKAKGIDVSPFTTHVKDGTTFLFPLPRTRRRSRDSWAPQWTLWCPARRTPAP
jgi:multiple sugar transport system substrate-binding protein